MLLKNLMSTKRGDTIIEVVFAVAIFSLVAVSSITIMNNQVSRTENTLELTTARSEINAQAEALRFIHSSYIAERSLPQERINTDTGIVNERYQQYYNLWNTIVEHAIDPETARTYGLYDLGETVNSNATVGATGCAAMYDEGTSGRSRLKNLNAFILNTRNLSSMDGDYVDLSVSFIDMEDNEDMFHEAPFSSRLLFANSYGDDNDNTMTEAAANNREMYRYLQYAEGIWVVAVRSDDSVNSTIDSSERTVSGSVTTYRTQYYDFYIQACWYGPDTTAPTAVDTVIRLYNPENF